MKFYTVLTITVALLVFTAIAQAAQSLTATQGSTTPFTPSNGALSQPRIVERLFTTPVLEPNGAVAVCLASNIDSVPRDLAAQIFNANGVEVTQTSTCGAALPAGATCVSTAHFANNSPLRCVIGTSASATTLRGGMTTSSGPFPFTSPANLTVPAQ